MIDFIFDTNILIYLSALHPKYIDFLEEMEDYRWGLSVISQFEFLVGVDSSLEANSTSLINKFHILALNEEIIRESVMTFRLLKSKGMRDPAYADIFIGHTALHYHVPLVTNNPKDFKMFKNLELISP